MKTRLSLLSILLVHLCLVGCKPLQVIQKPVTYDESRRQLSLDYLKDRYQMVQDEPTIVPKMIVVHWTVIPTMEKSFTAFNPPTLPDWRPEIANASGLNVAAQYLIDRDGTVYQLLPDTIMARHVIGLNHCSIGIENVGGGDKLPLTKAQFNSNVALIKALSKRHSIEYLIGHLEYQAFDGHPLWKEIDSGYRTEKTDPGADFMANLRKKLKHLNLKGPPG